MPRYLSLALPLLALVSGCAIPDPARSDSGRGVAITPAGYEGPDLAAKLEHGELHLAVRVRSGGYKLQLRETGRAAGHTIAKITLTAPGAEEVVTQAFEIKMLRVPLKREAGAVHVLLQQVQRGVSYITSPEFVIAKIVPR